MSRVHIDWTHYFPYEEYKGIVNQIATAYPEFVKVHSIARTHRNREVFLLEVTNSATGPADSKPAIYIDANMHAEEFCGTSLTLYTCLQLMDDYGKQERATRLLDTTTFHIVPRLDPDGAEYSLMQDYPWCGNGRFLPGEEQPGPGFYFADIDGDGFITQMRVQDPNGEWKISELDSRLMVLRRPDEYGGEYYRLFPEGMIRDFDGVEIQMPKPNDGNLNRNYPAQFNGPHVQYGSGEFPLSEPETRAIAEWFVTHRNIALAINYHTHGGVILRPFANRSDDHFPPEDLSLYKSLGQIGTECTGYPLISVYNDFTPVKSEPRGGTTSCFGYDEMGFPVIGVELWDVYGEAGIRDKDYYPLGPKSETDMVKLLKWQDTEMNGEGFVPWHTVDHPQFGQLEIGGWKRISVFRNPPGHLFEKMAQPNVEYALRLAATLPHLAIRDFKAEHFEGDLYQVTATVVNTGYLSTYSCQVGLQVKRAEPVMAGLTMSGGSVVMGEVNQSLGHLAGRAERRNEWSPWGNIWHSSAKKAEWLVRVPGGTKAEITIDAGCPRAGRISRTIKLD